MGMPPRTAAVVSAEAEVAEGGEAAAAFLAAGVAPDATDEPLEDDDEEEDVAVETPELADATETASDADVLWLASGCIAVADCCIADEGDGTVGVES
jgi:hypothetical protein